MKKTMNKALMLTLILSLGASSSAFGIWNPFRKKPVAPKIGMLTKVLRGGAKVVTTGAKLATNKFVLLAGLAGASLVAADRYLNPKDENSESSEGIFSKGYNWFKSLFVKSAEQGETYSPMPKYEDVQKKEELEDEENNNNENYDEINNEAKTKKAEADRLEAAKQREEAAKKLAQEAADKKLAQEIAKKQQEQARRQEVLRKQAAKPKQTKTCHCPVGQRFRMKDGSVKCKCGTNVPKKAVSKKTVNRGGGCANGSCAIRPKTNKGNKKKKCSHQRGKRKNGSTFCMRGCGK